MRIIKYHTISFKHAIEGILWSIKTQPNFRIHLILSGSVLFASYLLNTNNYEKIILIFTIILGLVVEMVNTAIESVTDLVSKGWSQEAKIAKDVSAGMMLFTSIGALIIALLILGPKIITLIK